MSERARPSADESTRAEHESPVDVAPRLCSGLVGRSEIDREVGRGGMATVYLARDLRHERRVALKALHPALGVGLSAERFLREIRVMAGLTHPHILPLHESGEAAGLLYYVIPYVEGETLRDRLARGPMATEFVLRLMRDIASALSYAHRHGVVHRDIKPENILLADDHAVVADLWHCARGTARTTARTGRKRPRRPRHSHRVGDIARDTSVHGPGTSTGRQYG